MSNQTLDELLKLLDEGLEEVPQKTEKKPKVAYNIKWFIRNIGLQEGEFKTPNYMLYYAFSRFMGKHKLKTMGREGFFRGINKFFESKRDGKQRYYMTNFNECVDITQDYIVKAKKYNDRINQKRKEKRVKKKES